MISWKCDGCGKATETEYRRVRWASYPNPNPRPADVYDLPEPPEDWWVGTRVDHGGLCSHTVYHFATACSGACCDAAQKKLGKVKWQWKAPEPDAKAKEGGK